MKIIKHVLDLLYPPKCLLCNRVLEKDQLDLCPDCRGQQPLCPVSKNKFPFIDRWIALWYYVDDAKESLRRYKFRGKRCYASGYGRLLAMKIQQELDTDYDLITWVPVSRIRRFKRSYDQVELLAKAVSRELDRPCVLCLHKIRDNPPQSTISGHAQRRANVLGAYRAVNKESFADKRVLILDDVITTGSTVGECARVLLTAGAKQVHCAALAVAKHEKKV